MQGEASAGEVASAAAVTVKQAHHRLTCLLSAGLIEITGTRKRSGRPIKVYRALATIYRVPFELTEAASVPESVDKLVQSFVAAYVRSIGLRLSQEADHDFLVRLNAEGQFSVNLDGGRQETEAHPQGAYGTFSQVRLGQESRRELEKRLRELKVWASAQETRDQGLPNAQACLIGLFFTPGELKGE